MPHRSEKAWSHLLDSRPIPCDASRRRGKQQPLLETDHGFARFGDGAVRGPTQPKADLARASPCRANRVSRVAQARTQRVDDPTALLEMALEGELQRTALLL